MQDRALDDVTSDIVDAAIKLHLAEAFRVDLLVQDRVIVEIKSTDSFHPVHAKQALTYLRCIVNNLPPGESPQMRVNRKD